MTQHIHYKLLNMSCSFLLHPLMHYFFFLWLALLWQPETQTTSSKREAMKKYTLIVGHQEPNFLHKVGFLVEAAQVQRSPLFSDRGSPSAVLRQRYIVTS